MRCFGLSTLWKYKIGTIRSTQFGQYNQSLLTRVRVIHDGLRGHDAKQYDSCHAINTRVLIYNANKAVNPYGGVIVLLS